MTKLPASFRARQLDLYLNGEFAKELLTERKLRLEKAVADLKREHADATAQMQTVAITDDQVESLKAFCEEVRVGLDHATFEDKRRYFDLLDVRGKLAIENDGKVIYVKCLLGKQRVSVVATSPSSCNHNVPPLLLTQRLVLANGITSVRSQLTFPTAANVIPANNLEWKSR